MYDQYRGLASPHSTIQIQDLYATYRYVCITKGITPLTEDIVLRYLSRVKYVDHTNMKIPIVQHAQISYAAYTRVEFIPRMYLPYRQIATNTEVVHLNNHSVYVCDVSTYAVMIVIMHTIESIILMQVVISKWNTYSSWLLLARSGAVIILYNLSLLLLHVCNISKYMDSMLGYKLASNKVESLHAIFGIKILIGTILHVIGHVGHVQHILGMCKRGCTYSDIHTLAKSNGHIVISWGYFSRQPAYYSGYVLTGLAIIMFGLVMTYQRKVIRAAPFYNYHRILSFLISLIIILHGLQSLLGFNLSYIFVLPPMLLYLGSRWREIFSRDRLRIIGWHISQSMIRLTIAHTPYIADQLNQSAMVSTYINHPDTSLLEWHPFTLINSMDRTESYIYIKRSGTWTEAFINNIRKASHHESMQTLNVGHLNPSSFRFCKKYSAKIFFCSGIGITPFLSVLIDQSENTNVSWLIWSINSMGMLREFSSELTKLSNLPYLFLTILYSNSAKQIRQDITSDQWNQFHFLHTMIHYHTGIDILHGMQIPSIVLLQRCNPCSILAHCINRLPSTIDTIGIFICSGTAYASDIERAAYSLRTNTKKIRLDVWSDTV